MASSHDSSAGGHSSAASFGAGLTEADVRRFQTILCEHCGSDIGLPGAWSRAIELLSLVEILLYPGSTGAAKSKEPQVRVPSRLTGSPC